MSRSTSRTSTEVTETPCTSAAENSGEQAGRPQRTTQKADVQLIGSPVIAQIRQEYSSCNVSKQK